MFAAILINFALPVLTRSTSFDALMTSCVYSDLHKACVWGFFAVFLILMFLGMSAAEAPFVMASKLFTVLYFVYFLLVLPLLNWFTRQLLEEKEVIVEKTEDEELTAGTSDAVLVK